MFVLRVSRSFTAIITRRIAFGDQPACSPFELGSRVAITKRLYELAGALVLMGLFLAFVMIRGLFG